MPPKMYCFCVNYTTLNNRTNIPIDKTAEEMQSFSKQKAWASKNNYHLLATCAERKKLLKLKVMDVEDLLESHDDPNRGPQCFGCHLFSMPSWSYFACLRQDNAES